MERVGERPVNCLGDCGTVVDDGRRYCRECAPDRGRGVIMCGICGEAVAEHPIGLCPFAEDRYLWARGKKADDMRGRE